MKIRYEIILGILTVFVLLTILLIGYGLLHPIKHKTVYIPVVIDSSKVALIHGQDTIYLYMNNAAILQEVPVLYLEQ